jgi:hypothetical protein
MKHPPHLDRRELATILAALRFHQDENLSSGPPIADACSADIASDGGTLTPLSTAEIDALCRRLNSAGKEG